VTKETLDQGNEILYEDNSLTTFKFCMNLTITDTVIVRNSKFTSGKFNAVEIRKGKVKGKFIPIL
jgi:hypothetical protein